MRQKSAKAAAFRFLKVRPQSIAELKEKLQNKGFSQTEIETTVLELTASGLLDDRAFTKSWINYRLARPFGFKRIITELRDKGVDEETIGKAVAEFTDQISSEDAALELAQRRWSRLSGDDPDKKKRKISDFLLRRGFSESTVMDVLRKL